MNPYIYQASLIKVIDGDTVDMLIDQGMGIFNKQRVRLYGINAYELNSPDEVDRTWAAMGREFLINNLPTDANGLIIETIKDKGDKYGRLLAKIYVDGRYINQALIEEGLAKPYLP